MSKNPYETAKQINAGNKLCKSEKHVLKFSKWSMNASGLIYGIKEVTCIMQIYCTRKSSNLKSLLHSICMYVDLCRPWSVFAEICFTMISVYTRRLK